MVDEDKNIGDANLDRETKRRALFALDADVAERVMGWHQSFIPPDDHYLGWFDTANALQKNVECWEPSTEIADAMEVVEKMRSDGWHLIFMSDSARSPSTWFADFLKQSKEHGEAGAETLPQAKPRFTRCNVFRSQTVGLTGRRLKQLLSSFYSTNG